MMVSGNMAKVSSVIDQLRPCIVTYTSSSVYIETKHRKFMFTNGGKQLKAKELGFVKRFRAYYQNNKDIKYHKRFAKFNSRFMKFFKVQGIHKDIMEIDINRAYPSAGKILGIIPDDLYNEGMQYSKTAFLVAVGSLYRKKKVIKVFANGKRELVSDEQPDEYMAEIWRSIVGFVDHAMQKAIAVKKESVYFYWCDALFVKRQDAQLFIDEIEKLGFQVKTKEIDRIEYQEDKAYVHYTGVNEPKTFSKPKRKYTVKSLNELIEKYEQKKK